MRLILESIYEPTFSDHSHGFRMNKSCHTALKYIQKYFTVTKWFVEGDKRAVLAMPWQSKMGGKMDCTSEIE